MATLLNRAGLVFRETPNADVGIDGHIELVNIDGEAPGATVAAQIKSGSSYLKESGNAWAFYPEEKHALYWEMYPLPVILMLHDPNSDMVYWDDVRLTLRSDQTKKTPLLIPREKVLIAEQATSLFASCGTSRNGLLLPRDVLKSLALSRNHNACFPLTYLDLFLEGLTDIGRKLFFSAGMCWDLAGLFLPNNSPTGVGMGSVEHDFLEGYLRFLVEQSLAHIDYSDIIIDIVHRQMHPTILVPLTARGRTVRDLCGEIAEVIPPSAITEATIGVAFNPMNAIRSLANHEVSKQIESHFLAKKKS